MSTPPPTPPPPRVSPPPPWTGQDVRSQRRAAASMARRQRNLLRAQRQANRRRSVVGPFLLIVLGGALFLMQVGRLSAAAALGWLASWWPLVLVMAGVILLSEWLLDTRRADGYDALPRRRLGAGAILLLVGLATAGAGFTALQHGRLLAKDRLGLAQVWGLDEWLTQHTDAVSQFEGRLKPGGTLTIDNVRGNVTVVGSSQDGLVHVTAHQRVWGWQASELQQKKDRNRPTLTSQHDGLLLRATGQGRDETELTIEVPHEAGLQIEPGKGELSISEVRGSVHVEEHAGNVVLAAVNGDVLLSVHDDDAELAGRSINGEVTVQGRSGDLTFSDIHGPLTLHGDFFGTTHLERIDGPVRFQSSFTNLACGGLPGELNVEGRSELQGRNLIGPVTLTTTDRDITLSDLQHGASITDQKGSVTLSFQDVTAPVNVTTTDGSVNVHLPDTMAFRVNAETADGDIENDFGLAPAKNDDRVSLTGQVRKGGPIIQLHTTEGDIELRKSSTSSGDEDTDGKQDTD